MDFNNGYRQRFGAHCPGVDAEGEAEKLKWQRIATTIDFFRLLPWTPWGREMWGLLKPTGAHILTSYSSSAPDSMRQKIEWGKYEAQVGTDRIVCVLKKKNKALYCQPGDILLDDHPDNIAQWNAAGGVGLLVTPEHNIDAAMTAISLWRKSR